MIEVSFSRLRVNLKKFKVPRFRGEVFLPYYLDNEPIVISKQMN